MVRAQHSVWADVFVEKMRSELNKVKENQADMHVFFLAVIHFPDFILVFSVEKKMCVFFWPHVIVALLKKMCLSCITYA